MDFNKLAEKLEKMGKAEVRRKVSQGAFQKRKLGFILWWLEQPEGDAPATADPEPVEELDWSEKKDVLEYAKELNEMQGKIQADMDEMIDKARESGEIDIPVEQSEEPFDPADLAETENPYKPEDLEDSVVKMDAMDESLDRMEVTTDDDSPSSGQSSDSDSESTEESDSEDMPE